MSLLLLCPGATWPVSAAGADPGRPATSSRITGPVRHIPALQMGAWAGPDPAPEPTAGLPSAPAPLPELLARSAGSAWPGERRNPARQPARDQPATKQKKKRTYSHSATTGSPGHIFWIVPAFKVNYAGKFEPLTPREKFQEWAQSAYDPLGLVATAIEAGTLEYSSTDGFCGYGLGFIEYLQCYGSMQLDANDSSFFGDFVFTVWWHQDPRYFRLGKGGFGKRALYSISRVFITFNDSGKNVFYSSGLAGTAMAAVVSNTYYPQQDRGVGLTLSRIAIDLGNTALYNGSAEFWPDIHHWLQKRF